MAFWTDATMEPKRAYRWIAIIGNMPSGASYYVKTVKKPSVEITKAEHNYLNHTFKYPGRVKWSTVSMTLVDPVNPDASQNLAAILENSGYIVPGKPSHVTTISKAGMVNSLGKVQIIQFNDGSTGTLVNSGNDRAPPDALRVGELSNDIEVWTLNNPIITKIDFGGELDYSKEDLTSLSIDFEYDWAELETANAQSLPANISLEQIISSPNARFKQRVDK